MKRQCLMLLLLLCLTVPLTATVMRNGNTVTVPASETINDDLVVSGGTVNVLGRVQGDLVAAGGTVNISGPVTGSLFVAGGTVNLNTTVGGSAFSAAGTLNADARVARNLVTMGGTVNAGAKTRAGRDLTVAAGTATIGAFVARNLQANAGTLTVTDTAHINGNLVAQTDNPHIASGAVIGGQRQVTAQAQPRRTAPGAGWGIAGWLLWQLFSGLALLLAGFLFIALAPRLTEETETTISQRPWTSLLAGLVVLLLGIPLFILLLVTIIGIPLALIWFWIYLTAVFISPIFLAIFVGRMVWRRVGGNLYAALAIGVGLLVLVRLVPFLGFLVTLAAMLFGIGALALALMARTAHPIVPPPATATA